MDNIDRFCSGRPVAQHTRDAFEQFKAVLRTECGVDQGSVKFILDSGCGTGRSSLVLGRLFPDHVVVGVDRSIDRLGRTARELSGPKHIRHGTSSAHENDSGSDDDEAKGSGEATAKGSHEPNTKVDIDNQDDSRVHVQKVKDNVLLVRVELVHFWRLWDEQGYVADRHYLLYPNPYPKKARLKQRWYAHPSFPILLRVSGGNPLIVRSNWKQYLQEFADSVLYASQHTRQSQGNDSDDDERHADHSQRDVSIAGVYQSSAQRGPLLRDPSTCEAWTNFEAKYDKVGEATFELVLTKQDYTGDGTVS